MAQQINSGIDVARAGLFFFESGDAAGDEVHLGLEVQGQRVARDGVAQVDLDIVAKLGLGAHFLGEQGDVVAACAFGHQGGLICLPQK